MKLRHALAATSCLTILAACAASDTTGIQTHYDPAATSDAAASLSVALDAVPISSLWGPFYDSTGMARLSRATGGAQLTAWPTRRDYAYVGPWVADSVKGRTYVPTVDPQAITGWSWATTRTGAPAGGVRLVLPIFNATTRSLQSIAGGEGGTLDAIDGSVAGTNRVAVSIAAADPSSTVSMGLRLVRTGSGDAQVDSATATMTDGQNHVLSYTSVAHTTLSTSRRTEERSLSTTGIRIRETLVLAALQAGDTERVSVSAGPTALVLTAPAVVQQPGGPFVVSDTTTMTAGGNVVGYAVYGQLGNTTAGTTVFLAPDRTPMPQAQADAYRAILRAIGRMDAVSSGTWIVPVWLAEIG